MSIWKPLLKEIGIAFLVYSILLMGAVFYNNYDPSAALSISPDYPIIIAKFLLVIFLAAILIVSFFNFLLAAITRLFIRSRSFKSIFLTAINSLKIQKLLLLLVVTIGVSFVPLTVQGSKHSATLNVSNGEFFCGLIFFCLAAILVFIIIVVKSIKLNKSLEVK